jgi:hypothetical protein
MPTTAPVDSVEMNRTAEPLERNLTAVLEREPCVGRTLPNGIRDQDLSSLRLGADPGRQVDGDAEQASRLDDRVSRVDFARIARGFREISRQTLSPMRRGR